MKTYKVLKKKEKEYDKHTFDVYDKEVNVYLVQLTEEEYCKAKKIFREKKKFVLSGASLFCLVQTIYCFVASIIFAIRSVICFDSFELYQQVFTYVSLFMIFIILFASIALTTITIIKDNDEQRRC